LGIDNFNLLSKEFKEHIKTYIQDDSKDPEVFITKYIEDNTELSFNTVIEFLGVLAGRGMTISEMFKAIRCNIDKKSTVTISTIHKLKGSQADEAELIGFKSPNRLFTEACEKYIRINRMNKDTPYDLVYADGYDDKLFRAYRSELMMIYTAITRARFKVDIHYK
jgi:superfamily I DNA/RNA helicase